MSPPTSRPPAGVPQGGNAKYAIVAVVLLLGIIAIVAVRVLVPSGRIEAATTKFPRS